uniref:Nucleophosmin n=1 Tax=Geotrypetes seraphini TaxID=260995 RepID=A0A6P8RZE0_GEOSA|nr:nucleophosmin-like isoform X1 [Geotrypetes seraphini]
MAEDPGKREAHVSIFGCQLTLDTNEYRFNGEGDGMTQQLVLQTVCLGADASDDLHRVEVEAANAQGKLTTVQLVALRSSILTTVSLAGFAITPPVSFRLKSGSGPVHISGHHFISQENSEEEEEENNTSPIKKPSKHQTSQGILLPSPKKLKFEDDSEDESEEEEKAGEDEENQRRLVKASSKTSGLTKKVKEKVKTPSLPKPPPSLSDIKDRLKSMSDKGHPLPKTEQKFENFLKSSFKLEDKKAANELWAFTQSLKGDK